MNQPDPLDVTVDTIIERGDILPEGMGIGKGLLLPAPWELMLMHVSGGDDLYRAYWCCPRCLDVGSLGHAVDIQADGHRYQCRSDENRDERDYLQIPEEDLQSLKLADSLSVDVEPSIGCRCCGFHCYLEGSTYRVLSDWNGANEERDPAQVFGNRVSHIKEHRPVAYERLKELVEGDS